MPTKYDVVVIGAGLGGMSAAVFLARQGKRVLLLERHNVPGGYASSFVRGRFEFEVALHVLSDIGTPEKPGALMRYLDYLGVADKLEFVDVPDVYRSVFPDLDIRLPADSEGFLDALCQEFPHDADGIKRFVERVLRISRELEHIVSLQRASLPSLLFKVFTLPLMVRAFPRYFFTSLEEVLNRDVSDKQARAVLAQIWSYLGPPPSQVSFIYFALALGSFLRFGANHIQGRSQALSNAFIATLRELGGEVRFNSGVERIIVQGNKVTGVITEDGHTYWTSAIVSNADPVTTCREMIGLDHLPPSYFRRLQCMEPSPSVCSGYLGVAKPLDYFGVSDHEIFVNADYDFDSHHNVASQFKPPGMTLVCCYNSILPTISPPDTAAISLTSLAYGDHWCNLRSSEYFQRKNAVGDAMIEMAERVLPGLREQIEVVEISTPLTHMRFASSLNGSIYGFNNPPHNHTILRPSVQGPLAGLYFAGAWSQPGGGFAPTIFSGNMAGMMAMRQLKRRKS